MYPIVKHFHVILVITSITLFQYRYWMYHVNKRNAPKAMKILPHCMDTLLLISGITMAIWIGLSPLQVDWLLFKLVALLFYIILGMLAMKKSGITQWFCYVAASLAVVYMIMAANQKSALPNFQLYFT